MKTSFLLILLVFAGGSIHAADLQVSSKEPIIVVAPDHWKSNKDTTPLSAKFPFVTYQVVPPDGRNAVCLISILDKDHPDVTGRAWMINLLVGDCRPYVNSADDLTKVDVKELKIKEGTAWYANFVDPDLAGKPIKKGKYKTATPVILSIGTKYLIKATILCDEIDGADYRDAVKILQSIKIKKE